MVIGTGMARRSGVADIAWRDASTTPFWLDVPDRPAARGSLAGRAETDLVVVGGGFSGLWTALQAKERDPSRDVVLVEGQRIGWAASGRNGGFCSASLTHGESNGLSRFPGEYARLHELGLENLDGIGAAVQRYGIDCGYRRVGTLSVATHPWQLATLSPDEGLVMDREQVQAQVRSPRYLGGVWDTEGSSLVDPARLAWGLADACERLGVRIVEHSAVTGLRRDRGGVGVTTADGYVRARQAVLGTNAFRPLLSRLRLSTVPVYDYVLVTEPLTPEQLASIGWDNRQGVSERTNQFHYSRMTDDGRILWGGYDAVYHYGRRVEAQHDQRPQTFARLSEQFFETFPQLAGIRFSHRWGGAIDTCTRFCAFFGTARRGRVAYGLGYTGLGVGSTRFGANVMLDLLAGEATERTALEMVRKRPVPFPPEPIAYLGIQATRAAMAAADRHEGRRNAWLRTLDRLGLGFDS